MSRRGIKAGSSGWGQLSTNMRPRGLKGKQIGLYYRDQCKKRREAGEDRPVRKREFVIHFELPPAVKNKVEVYIGRISTIAKNLKIPIVKPELPVMKIEVSEKETAVTMAVTQEPIFIPDVLEIEDTDFTDDIVFKKPEPISKAPIPLIKKEPEPITKTEPSEDMANNEQELIVNKTSEPLVNQEPEKLVKKELDDSPSTSYTADFIHLYPSDPSQTIQKPSTAPDFIPISQTIPPEYLSEDRLLSLRGGGDYKYGYEDIITGTFEEKLDQALMNGISINSSSNDIQDLNARFYEEYKEMVNKTKYKEMKKFRDRLPTFKKSQELLDTINNNQVVVISGETGCGKSTQVPQIILDDAICRGKGANVKILVTQPRRIAASSLAARVAEERAEQMGNTVGYAVRLEGVEARDRGSIMFVTTGILLAELEVDQGLTNNTHVIIDEVHERDCHVDLSMCMLKIVLRKRKDLKLILMSATIDADKISQYFDNCPMLHIQGLAYPVIDIFLEDILDVTQFQLREDNSSKRPVPNWMKHRKRKPQNFEAKKMEREVKYRAEISPWIESMKKKMSHEVFNTLLDPRIEDLNHDLVVELLIHLLDKPPGAILVFLPGIGDITKVMRKMTGSGMFPQHKCEVYPLHSKLPSLDQRKIFERPPEHIRKIIIATNIAETSITIDDIVYVVDCGKVKMKGLNVEDHLTTLDVEWVSQASLRQRRGRAGRCQPGVCYHLLTSFRASTLPERLLPELQRSDLLEPVLCIKRLRLGKAIVALNMVPSPPAKETIERAVKHLQQLGALSDEEILTPLGWHLARLPVHPAAGKLLLLGTLFGCLDRAASVAAVWGFKDPFQLVIGKEQEVDAARNRLSLGEPSDHVVISEAIIQWENTAIYRRHNFCFDNFLSHNTIELLSEMKKQFGDSLKQMGWLTSGDVKSNWENRNAGNISLFKAIVAASLYPNVVSVRWKNTKRSRRVITIMDPDKKRMYVHPSSVVGKELPLERKQYKVPVKGRERGGGNWLVYWLKQKSAEVYLIEVTIVYTLPLLFFGELKVCSEDLEPQLRAPDEVDFKITTTRVRCQRKTAELLFHLKSLLDQVLAAKVNSKTQQQTLHSEFEKCVLDAVAELITAEDEGAEYIYDESDSDQSLSEHEFKRH